MQFTKWRTVLALIPLVIAIVMGWWWFFTLLFMLQILTAFQTGSIEYVETIVKTENPILFWTILSIWTFLAIYTQRKVVWGFSAISFGRYLR